MKRSKKETFRFAPQEMHQLDAELLRLEQRWRGGFKAATLEAEWKHCSKRAAIKSTTGRSCSSAELAAHSLALKPDPRTPPTPPPPVSADKKRPHPLPRPNRAHRGR